MDIASLGELIKNLRKEKGMTQEDLASKLGLTTSAVSKWETGKNSPDISMLHKLSEILEVSLEELYTPEEALIRRSSKTLPVEATDVTAPKLIEDTSKTNTDASGTPEASQSNSTKRFRKYKGILLAIVVLLTISLISIAFYSIEIQNEELNIRPYAYRISEDEYCGTVYETACIYSGTLESLTQDAPYIQQLSTAWKNNTHVEENIIFLKVSFYSSEEQAKNWNTPQKSIYLVR